MAHIHIIEAETSPVRLHVNGRSAVIIVGMDTEIDDHFLPALKDCDPTIRWRLVGDKPAAAPDVVAEAEAQHDPDFNPEAIIAGTVDDIEPQLATLTPHQLDRVRAAEIDREKPRKGVIAALDKLIAESN